MSVFGRFGNRFALWWVRTNGYELSVALIITLSGSQQRNTLRSTPTAPPPARTRPCSMNFSPWCPAKCVSTWADVFLPGALASITRAKRKELKGRKLAGRTSAAV